jgi:hypothetical protein
MTSLHMRVAVLLVTLSGLASGQATPPSPFIVKPYLQLGDASTTGDPTTLSLMWQTDTGSAKWEVETKAAGSSEWVPMRSF